MGKSTRWATWPERPIANPPCGRRTPRCSPRSRHEYAAILSYNRLIEDRSQYPLLGGPLPCYKRSTAKGSDNGSRDASARRDLDHEILVNSGFSRVSGKVLGRDLFTLLGLICCG